MKLEINPAVIPAPPFALAFSGGGDSTALLYALRSYNPHVIIVDHGLRRASADEARGAQAFAQSLGLSADILTWKPGGIKAGLQAKARRARYRLIGDKCRALGIGALLTGHSQDDQAETVLMRLNVGGNGNGSGWRGAAAMRAVTPTPLWPELASIDVYRPMLGISRADILRYLAHHTLPYLDDPSNQNRDFTRIRARDSLANDRELRADMLTLARDMGEARTIENARFAALFARRIAVDEFGCIHIKGRVANHMLARLLRAASGQGGTAHSQSLARLNAAMKLDGFKGATLSGAAITPTENGYVLTREPSRRRIANRNLQSLSLWDGRFWIEGGHSVKPAAGSLGALPKAIRAAIAACPPSARPMLPMLSKDGVLVAVGPYSPDGTASKVVKSAVNARLLREFALQTTKVD